MIPDDVQLRAELMRAIMLLCIVIVGILTARLKIYLRAICEKLDNVENHVTNHTAERAQLLEAQQELLRRTERRAAHRARSQENIPPGADRRQNGLQSTIVQPPGEDPQAEERRLQDPELH